MNKFKQTLLAIPKSNRTYILIALAALIVMCGFVGGSYAFFTDKSGVLTNTGSVSTEKHVNIGVVEDGKTTDPVEEGTEINYTQVPENNEAITKVIRIRNINKDKYQTGPTYVRVKLVPVLRDNDTSDDEADENTVGNHNLTEANLELVGMDANWVKDDTTGYYYYKEAIYPDQNTNPLSTAVSFTNLPATTDTSHYEIRVLTEGIAATVDDNGNVTNGNAQTAWNIDPSALA